MTASEPVGTLHGRRPQRSLLQPAARSRRRASRASARLPFSLKILLENLLRHEDGRFVKAADIEALARWDVKSAGAEGNLLRAGPRAAAGLHRRARASSISPPCATASCGSAAIPNRVNPLQPVELVIDHSVQVDYFGQADAFQLNAELEFSRNRERYAFLRWGQNAFHNFRVVPPDTGIVHQVNLEYLARVVCPTRRPTATVAYPDTLVGTDSHTTMVNGLGSWAGASAASRPRRRCSASRSRCSSRRCSVSG